MNSFDTNDAAVGLLIVAHSPLASALRDALLHVFADAAQAVAAVDITADEDVAQARVRVRRAREALGTKACLVFTDVMGATPCNVACHLADGAAVVVVAGVNLPMLLRTANYLHEPINALVERALAGGVQCILRVPFDPASTAKP